MKNLTVSEIFELNYTLHPAPYNFSSDGGNEL